MSDPTKSCNLTETEISSIINNHCHSIIKGEIVDDHIERINYLNKRLKAFKEPDKEPITADTDALNFDNQQIKSPATATQGWGTNG